MKKFFALLLASLVSAALVISASASGSEISYGKSYTLVTPASSAYPDNSAKLTDGIFGTRADGKTNYYSSGAYIGFNRVDTDENGNFVIILDLGLKYYDISAVTVGYLNETSAGIYAPSRIALALSDERNGEYTELATLDTAKPTDDGLSETYAATVATDDVSGRFLRVTITHLGEFVDKNGEIKNPGWTFIDEISVYSSGNAAADNESESNTSRPTPEASTDESSQAPESSTPEIPNAGDNGGILAFVLLAVSSVAMIAALFTNKAIKNRF